MIMNTFNEFEVINIPTSVPLGLNPVDVYGNTFISKSAPRID